MGRGKSREETLSSAAAAAQRAQRAVPGGEGGVGMWPPGPGAPRGQCVTGPSCLLHPVPTEGQCKPQARESLARRAGCEKGWEAQWLKGLLTHQTDVVSGGVFSRRELWDRFDAGPKRQEGFQWEDQAGGRGRA